MACCQPNVSTTTPTVLTPTVTKALYIFGYLEPYLLKINSVWRYILSDGGLLTIYDMAMEFNWIIRLSGYIYTHNNFMGTFFILLLLLDGIKGNLEPDSRRYLIFEL